MRLRFSVRKRLLLASYIKEEFVALPPVKCERGFTHAPCGEVLHQEDASSYEIIASERVSLKQTIKC